MSVSMDTTARRRVGALPMPKLIEVLAGIGVLAIITGSIGGLWGLWQYRSAQGEQALSRFAEGAWVQHWADTKDADGKATPPPPVVQAIQYPERAFLYVYRGIDGKLVGLAYLHNQDLPAGFSDVWLPVAINEAK